MAKMFDIKPQVLKTPEQAYAELLGNSKENQIVEIPNDKIVENNNQRFIIHDDTVTELAESIAKDGQISPCIVAPLSDGKYELIDGRHRRRAVIEAGLPTTKCIIRTDLTEVQKRTIRLTTNLIRNNDYLPSELAFAYKELYELEGNMQKISEETNLSKKKIYRYIRLTNLIRPLLDRIDSNNIPVIAAVEISYLSETEQKKLFEFMLNHPSCKVTTDLARKLKNDFRNIDYYFWKANPKEFTYDYDDAPQRNNHVHVDNLSTEQDDNKTKSNIEVDKLSTSNNDTDNSPTKKLTENSNNNKDIISDISLIDENALNKITEIFINKVKADRLIITEFYSTAELIDYIKQNYVDSHNYSGCPEYDCSFRNRFNIKFRDNHKSYSISYKDLDNQTRIYIRSHYNKEKIANCFEESGMAFWHLFFTC